jgi:class 3 adenylate cyclase
VKPGVDKFTGDGFVAYFNESICRAAGSDHIDCFLSFLREELEFAGAQFSEWVRHARKLPEKPIGLAVGADLGLVSFQNLKYHLVAVGEPIVWASRMASCAAANEVVVNNLLFEALNGRCDVQFARREASTKSGEGFLGRVLRWTDGG